MRRKKIGKRLLGAVLALSLAAGSVPLPPTDTARVAQAAETESLENIEYITDTNGQITGFNGSADTLDLKAIFGDKTIDSIGEAAFANQPQLVKVIIPKTVKTIGLNAFYGCGSLTTVEFEEGSELEKIYCGAFARTNLHSIHIPGTVTSLGADAERQTLYANGVRVGPNSGTNNYNYGTFYECTNLAEVVFEEGTKPLKLSEEVNQFRCGGDFSGCSALTSIAFPDRVETIPADECCNASNLSDVTLPKNLTEIGKRAFYETAVTGDGGDARSWFPDTLEKIGDDAFYGSSFSGKVEFPDSLESIGASAFAFTSVTDVTFPAALETIGNNGFYTCNDLRSATFLGDTSFGNINCFPQNVNSSNTNCVLYAYKDKGESIRNACQSNKWNFNYLADSIAVKKAPDKLKYTYGDTLDTTGLVLSVTALNSDGTKEEVEIKGADLASCQFSGYDAESVGPQEVAFSYGKKNAKFDVAVRYDLNSASSSELTKTYTYTGDPVVPASDEVKLTYKNGAVVPSSYYGVTGSNNVEAGSSAKYTVTATNEDYTTGSYTKGTFRINQRDLSDEGVSVSLDPQSLTYTGGECLPQVKVTYTNPSGRVLELSQDTDYTVVYSDNTEIGTAKVTVTGKGNYTGKLTTSFSIIEKEPEETQTPSQSGETQTPSQPGETQTPSQPGQTQTPSQPGQTQTPSQPGQTQTPSTSGQSQEKTQKDDEKDSSASKKQTIKVKVLSQKIKASKLKKKSVTFSIKASAQGKITCKKVSGSKNLTISKTGKVKIKKKTKKGTYQIKVKITAAEKNGYEKTVVTKKIKVTVY